MSSPQFDVQGSLFESLGAIAPELFSDDDKYRLFAKKIWPLLAACREDLARCYRGDNGRCAAGHNGAGGRPALAQSRSRLAHPRRVKLRLPAEPVALAPTSNRKALHEGHYISSMDSRAKRRQTPKQQNKTMNDPLQWQQHRAFGALDWASQTHCVVVVDQIGKVIEDFLIEHSALGWKKF